MEGAKMVDKTNMSLDDIIKLEKKKFKGNSGFLRNKNTMARNVVKKARNSFINRKPLMQQRKNFNITEKRVDVRSRLVKAKQFNNKNKIIPQNIQKTTRNSNFQRQNRTLNVNHKPRINNRINSNVINSAPAFRITTNNERYQSSNVQGRQYERPITNRNSYSNSFNALPYNRNQNNYFSSSRRPSSTNDNYYQGIPQTNQGRMRKNPNFSREREYGVMARALIEAHKESRHAVHSSHNRYNYPMETRGYPYRR